jgi:hypothetical protein
LAFCAAAFGVPMGTGRDRGVLIRKTDRVKTQIERLKDKIKSLKEINRDGQVCEDINFANSKLTKGTFGGLTMCCSVCKSDKSKICCPTKACLDSFGEPARKPNKDGKGSYCPEINVKDTMVKIDPKTTDAPGFYNDNMCPGESWKESTNHENYVTCGKEGGDSCLRFDGIGRRSNGPKISVIVRNITAYNPVWSYHDVTDQKKFQGKKGYLFNGRKAGVNLEVDKVQLNLCNNRHVKSRYSFVDENDEPITMKRAAIRLFNLDQGKRGGPETVQFMCSTSASPGGTFTLYGDKPAMHSSANAKLRETVPGASPRGSPKHVFHCPEDEWVTLWSQRLGDLADNPVGVGKEKLTASQEQSMLLINFTYVEHFDLIFANMPEQYRQESCVDSHGKLAWAERLDGSFYCPRKHLRHNFALAAAGECPADSPGCAEEARLRGNPLNSSLEICPENFPGLGSGECGLDEGGRNWVVAGLSDAEVEECAPATSAPPPPPPFVRARDDPVFTVGQKGNSTHLWRLVLTCASRTLRKVRTCYLYQLAACGTYRRLRAARPCGGVGWGGPHNTDTHQPWVCCNWHPRPPVGRHSAYNGLPGLLR